MVFTELVSIRPAQKLPVSVDIAPDGLLERRDGLVEVERFHGRRGERDGDPDEAKETVLKPGHQPGER